jgi:hypothetical protein
VPADVTASPAAPASDRDDLIRQLGRTTGLPANVVARVVDDVLAYYDETVEEFVRRRHRQLQRRGHTNDRIFTLIAAELPARRFAPGELSLRQLRRIVYG